MSKALQIAGLSSFVDPSVVPMCSQLGPELAAVFGHGAFAAGTGGVFGEFCQTRASSSSERREQHGSCHWTRGCSRTTLVELTSLAGPWREWGARESWSSGVTHYEPAPVRPGWALLCFGDLSGSEEFPERLAGAGGGVFEEVGLLEPLGGLDGGDLVAGTSVDVMSLACSRATRGRRRVSRGSVGGSLRGRGAGSRRARGRRTTRAPPMHVRGRPSRRA